jgi:hypothetical protein
VNELVQLVQQEIGLSQDVAEKAVDAVLEFIKQKLPASMASSLDSLLGGGAQAAAAAAATAQTAAATGEGKVSGMMAEAKELLGGILGKKAGSGLAVKQKSTAPLCMPLATRISARRRSVA